MKICIVISSLLIGGSSQVVVDLATGLKEKGCAVSVVSIWDLVDEKYGTVLRDNNIALFTADKKNKFDYMCYKRLKKHIKDINPNFLITNLTSLFYCWLCKCHIQILHIIHSEPKKDIPRIYRVLMHKDIEKGKIKFIGCSNSVTKKAKKLYKTDVECINNGTNLPEITFAEKRFDFVFVGRLSKVKRLMDLVKAFEIVKKIKKNATLCLVGEGPMKRTIEHYVNNKKLQGVHMVGRSDNVFDFLSKSKVFCLFSSYEGGPICLLEAMHCGLPVVCSDAEGNLNFAQNGLNASVFKVGDYISAAYKMDEYLENALLYEEHSKKSLELSRSFSLEKMVNSYYNYLKRIYR